MFLLRLQDKAGEAHGAAKDTYNQAGSKASELGSKAQVRRAFAVGLWLFVHHPTCDKSSDRFGSNL